jgi:hypothetical protein
MASGFIARKNSINNSHIHCHSLLCIKNVIITLATLDATKVLHSTWQELQTAINKIAQAAQNRILESARFATNKMGAHGASRPVSEVLYPILRLQQISGRHAIPQNYRPTNTNLHQLHICKIPPELACPR